jgi:hypothetical protein
MVEPHSLVITGLYATTDRDAETWGGVLLLTQDRQVQIQGLAENGCIPCAASCREAGLAACRRGRHGTAHTDTRRPFSIRFAASLAHLSPKFRQ